MCAYLRKIDMGNWYQASPPEWLREGEIPSDPICDFNTDENDLSLWRVGDDEDVKRIMGGLAAARSYIPNNLDYVTAPEAAIDGLGLKIEATTGNSADDDINRNLHRDVRELDARRLTEVAKVFWTVGKTGRLLKDELVGSILDRVDRGDIKYDQLKEDVRKKLDSVRGKKGS